MSKTRLPSYCLKNNSSGKTYAYVTLNGKRISLGPDGQEAKEKYKALIAEWLSGGKFLPTGDSAITIQEMAARYLKYAKLNYSGSTEYGNYKTVVKILLSLYGSTNANEFGPKKLEAVRQVMIEKGWQRSSINKQVMRVRSIFRWAESKELIVKGMADYLATMIPLKKGRCPDIPEGEDVKPVPVDDIEAIKPYLSRQVWAMIQLQLYTAARPGEIVIIRIMDIDRSEQVWIYKPEKHKNQHRDMDREIYLGLKAQEILTPFLFGRFEADYIFSPKEANAEAKQKNADSKRREDQKSGKAKTARTIGNHYTTSSYRKAIHRACEKAGVEKWSPNQLRHNAGTVIRKEYGVEAAQVMLGHARADVTQIYAERDREKAKEIAKNIG